MNQIRRLVQDDQQFLWEILYEALWDPPEGPRRPRSVLEPQQIRVYAEAWGSKPDDLGFVVLSESSVPVGAIWSRLLVPPEQGGAFFDHLTPQLGIAIFPAHQGQGLGGELFRSYLSVAREAHPGVSLSVHPANTRAIRLYQRFGFGQFGVGGGGYLQMVLHFDRAN